MKKFLSLLLALTLVLSLVVVPARADVVTPAAATGTTIDHSTFQLENGADTNNTLIVNTSNAKVGTTTCTPKSYEWKSSAKDVATVSGENGTGTITPKKAGTTVISCKVTYTYTEESNETPSARTPKEAVQTVMCNLTVYDCKTAIDKIFFNGRDYAVTGSSGSLVATVYYDASEVAQDATAVWRATSTNSNYTITNPSSYTSATTGNNTVPFAVNSVTNINGENVNVTASLTPLSNPTINSAPASAKTGQAVSFTLTSTTSKHTSVRWFYKEKNAADSTAIPATVTHGSGNSYTWSVPDDLKGATYTLICALSESSIATATSAVKGSTDITVTPDTNKLSKGYTVTVTPGSSANLSFTFTNASNESLVSSIGTVTWTVSRPNSGATTGATLGSATTTNSSENTISIASNAPYTSYTVTATFDYQGKTYTVTYPVTVKTLTAALSPIQNNTAVTLYGYNYGYGTSNNLFAIAQAALNTASISATVSYVTLDTGSRTNCYIQQTSGASSAYYTYTITGTSIGTASFTGTVHTNKGNYPITFTATVTPISTTYEAQYPEPVAYGNTYRYYVQVPANSSYYYVVGTPNQTTIPTDFSQSGKTVYYANTTSTNLYPLTDSNFVNGQCTLWIVTKNSSDNRLYYGQLTVYQKNYNINYNGVTGETVQFAQSDFTDFMNEVAEARGDASKTKSYPYVTFDYVTFSLPTTAQGTLYYGGTAMSTSNSSGAFNTRTKVTNLDSVTFVPNAKTTAKTITLNFTLYATRYSSSSTSRGTTVSYSGSVVVNLVREDIKYTVSQGDSVRFDESDFLSYLRSTKGYTSNYTIDYVTFDQSAVSAVNEGSLYTYYNGYNYGGSVKTTDKFYYSATASQNALSDVAFLASRYAKTGETVYIPFTIYARYGTTGTGTRQLTGTVAIKIGQTMNFIDVKTTDYFYNSVKWAVGKNITNGTSSTTFSPYKSCTRAEIVTFLWRAAGSPEPTITRNPFRDVNAVTHSSYYKAILWASQKGITSGTSATAFSPDQVCTRAQIVTFLYRYAGQPSGYYSNPFKDVSATNEASYYNAILWASGKGITTGSSPTTFSPYASCNRAEAVTFLYRYTNGL